MRPCVWPAMRFMDRLDNEAESPQLPDVVRPTWPRVVNRGASASAGVDELFKRPSVTTNRRNGRTIRQNLDRDADLGI